MYAIVEKNKLRISIAQFYDASWYDKKWPLTGKEKFDIAFGRLEVDIHKGGKKYLTGFTIDPREFVVDYLKTRYKKTLPAPKRIESVSIDGGEDFEMFTVDFMKARSFVINGMEKDLIFPQFTRKAGELVIQGFEVLSVISMLRYLSKRFKYKGTTLVRNGENVCDLKTNRRWKIRRKSRAKKT